MKTTPKALIHHSLSPSRSIVIFGRESDTLVCLWNRTLKLGNLKRTLMETGQSVHMGRLITCRESETLI